MSLYSWKVEYGQDYAPWGFITVFSLVTAAMAVFFIFSQNFLGAFLFTIIPIALILSVAYSPKEISGMIDDTYIVVNNKKHSLEDIDSFYIVPGHLILKMKEKDAVYIPVNLEDEMGIRDVLKEKMEEKKYDESLFDIFYRILKIH